MKRITVSLPDDLVVRVRAAAGGEGQVSAYVARALAAYQERESLDDILADWAAETPVSADDRSWAEAALRTAGFPESTSDAP